MERMFDRERACFDLLTGLSLDRKFVLIGGFAVSAFGFPRMSIDLDMAVPNRELGFFRGLLEERGFELAKEASDFDKTYGGRFERYVRKDDMPVSVDLLIDSVQARQTGHPYSFRYLFGNSEIREVRGWLPSSKAKTRVPDREMLIALKMNSMRSADKRDIIMLCYEMPDVDRVFGHIKNCPRDAITTNVSELSGLLEDPGKRDSIKGAFSISNKVLSIAVKNCRGILDDLGSRLM